MSAEDVESLKEEVENDEKTLNELVKKWDDDVTLKRLSKQEQTRILRTVVSAKRVASVFIPKIKFKIDIMHKTPNDRRLWGITVDEWNTIKLKVEKIQREFEIQGTVMKGEYPSREQKERDLIMSKNIEESLRRRRQQGQVKCAMSEAASSSKFPEDGGGDVIREATVALPLGDVDTTRDFGVGDAEPSTNLTDDDRQLLGSVKTLKEQLSKGRSTLSEIVDDVCPDVAGSVKKHLRSLAASETITVDNVLSQEMLDEIRGFDADEIDRRRSERSEKLEKSDEIRNKRIQKLEKMTEIEELPTRPILPSPLPMDGFLDVVETLPGEIRKLVFKETEELSDYYKTQLFSKKPPLFCRRGKLTSLNRLKPEYGDERFDGSDYHMRVPESALAETQKLMEHEVDNAVKRYFGTFGSQSESSKAEALESPQDDDGDDEKNFGQC